MAENETKENEAAAKKKKKSLRSSELYNKMLANRLKTFREQYIHKTQRDASKLLGIAQSTYSYMEAGKMPIYLDFITQLSRDYGLNIEWLATGNGKPKDKNPPKANLITDINLLNDEIDLLKKQIKILQVQQNHFIMLIQRLEQKIEDK